jgi:hypothetical protein
VTFLFEELLAGLQEVELRDEPVKAIRVCSVNDGENAQSE